MVIWLYNYGFGEVSSSSCLKEISSNYKYLILQIIFCSKVPVLSLKLLFMSAKDRVNLIIFAVTLFMVCQMKQPIVLAVQCFIWRETKVLLFVNKVYIVSITFHKSQRSNIRNQYHQDGT